MPRGSEKTPLTETEVDPGCFQANIVVITRLCGAVVAIALWAATVAAIKGDYKVPNYVEYYLIGTSMVVTIFELTWLLDKCHCCRRDGCCCGCCLPVIMWVDGWRKFVLYTALSVLLFLQTPNGAFLAVCGCLLLLLACLYLLKSCRCRCARVTSTSEKRTTVTETRHQETSTTNHDGGQGGSRLVTITTRSEVSEKMDKADAGTRNATSSSSSGVAVARGASSSSPGSSMLASSRPTPAAPNPFEDDRH